MQPRWWLRGTAHQESYRTFIKSIRGVGHPLVALIPQIGNMGMCIGVFVLVAVVVAVVAVACAVV